MEFRSERGSFWRGGRKSAPGLTRQFFSFRGGRRRRPKRPNLETPETGSKRRRRAARRKREEESRANNAGQSCGSKDFQAHHEDIWPTTEDRHRRASRLFCGDERDRHARRLLQDIPALNELFREVRLFRLFRATDALASGLGERWLASSSYAGASDLVKLILEQERLIAAERDPQGCNLMELPSFVYVKRLIFQQKAAFLYLKCSHVRE